MNQASTETKNHVNTKTAILCGGDGENSESDCTNGDFDEFALNEENNDNRSTETSFLQLPSLVREQMYLYLSQKDLLSIRSSCLQLLCEVDNFADFSVVMKRPREGNNVDSGGNVLDQEKRPIQRRVSIPFPYLKLLTIDNDQQDLPWNVVKKGDEDEEKLNDSSSSPCLQKCMNVRGSVESVHLGAISFQTFLHLSRYKTIKSATLTTSAFVRPIPTLHWTFLKTLKVKFVCTSNIEQFMLDNFDSLCVQFFPHLETLSIAMCNTVYPNIQSAYSIRILRFVTKHWQSLRSLEVSMEAECCISHHYVGQHMCPGLTELDLADMKNVQLTMFTLNATELSCPRCSIWQEFIRQQMSLQTVEISISCAMRLRSDFFCPLNPGSTKNLQSVIITMWGMDGYFPFDFRHLVEATNLRNLELVRHTQTRSQLSRPELLNVSSIPPGIVSLTLNGFLINSSDVPVLLKRTPLLRNLILIDCGFGLDIGVLLEHICLLAQHPSYATAIIDFNTPVISTEDAITILSDEMDSHQLIFQYLFEIPGNKNLRFWFVHPDRVELARGGNTNLEQTGYSKDVLLSCDVLSEYTQHFYFDDEMDDENEDSARGFRNDEDIINNNSNNSPALLRTLSPSLPSSGENRNPSGNVSSSSSSSPSMPYFRHNEISGAEECHHQEAISTAS